MQYHICGANRTTGEDAEVTVEAESEEAAIALANEQEILAADVQEVPDAPGLPETLAEPEGSEAREVEGIVSLATLAFEGVMGQYSVRLDRGEASVEGPNEALAKRLRERVATLSQVPEGRDLLRQASGRLAVALHVPAESTGTAADTGQIAEARAQGLRVDEGIANDELAWMVGDLELVRRHVMHVFGRVFHEDPEKAGVAREDVERVVMSVLGDPVLCARVVAAHVLRTAETHPPYDSPTLSVALSGMLEALRPALELKFDDDGGAGDDERSKARGSM
jgi:hypothetical protein